MHKLLGYFEGHFYISARHKTLGYIFDEINKTSPNI